MKKVVYASLFGFFAALGMACAFISQIPNYYLSDSFGILAFCCLGCIVFLFSIFHMISL